MGVKSKKKHFKEKFQSIDFRLCALRYKSTYFIQALQGLLQVKCLVLLNYDILVFLNEFPTYIGKCHELNLDRIQLMYCPFLLLFLAHYTRSKTQTTNIVHWWQDKSPFGGRQTTQHKTICAFLKRDNSWLPMHACHKSKSQGKNYISLF